MDVILQIVEFFSTHKFIFTLVVLVFIYGLRRLILSQIRGDDVFVTQEQRKWMATTKNINLLVIVVVLFYLWQSEINEFALSVTAIAVAIVVASKEIILCFTGSFQRASSRSFQIGDWIEVGKYSGEVIDHSLMATVIQEIDLHHGQYDYTGKTITLPNSLFFTHPVKNLNFMKRYVFHNFGIIVPNFVNLYPLLGELEKRIEAHCEYFIEVARRYNIMIEKHAGVDLPSAEPHIHISSMPNGEQNVHVVLFCPTDKAVHLEQEIRKDFMELYEAKFVKDE